MAQEELTQKENEVIDINVDDLFKDFDEPAERSEVPPTEPNIMTKAVSDRINEVKRKTQAETKESIAKELGYESYADMTKKNEKKLLKDAGLDDNDSDIENVINKIVEKRLLEDPRFKKLEEFENLEKSKFVNSQLKEINELSKSFNGEVYDTIDKLPKDTLTMWEKTGNLKQAYLATQGENLLTRQSSSNKNGTLTHLANGGFNSSSRKSRGLTEEEKDIWRSIIPGISDDELSKKTIEMED